VAAQCVSTVLSERDIDVRTNMISGRQLVVGALLAVVAVVAVNAVPMKAQRGLGALGTVYVTSQGLYYDTFVAAQELPPRGRFQLLENGQTDYGPGEPGYLGGRWMVPNGEGGFDYFLCPLLGPGRSAP
jgi:hypothetical protein